MTSSARASGSMGSSPARPASKLRIQERLVGFPGLSTDVEDPSQRTIKSFRGLFGAEFIPVHMRTSRPQSSGCVLWFCHPALRMRQSGGNIDDTGSVRSDKADRISSRQGLCRVTTAAGPGLAGHREAGCTCAGRCGPVQAAPAAASRLARQALRNGHGRCQ